MEDNVLYDLPTEFLAEIASSSSDDYCDAQSIVPNGGHYVCHCTCGQWDVVTDTREEGLTLARKHTAEDGK